MRGLRRRALAEREAVRERDRLARRRADPAHAPRALAMRDLWCAPGGFCDHHEDPRDTAVREALEETGVRIRVGEILGIWVQAYADDPDDDECDWISVAYYAADALEDEGEPDPAEVSEQRWFAPGDVPADLAPPDTLTAVLDAWEARRAGAR